MVYNEFIKCEVCGCVTRIRLQVGWLDEHPIAVTCGKCGISLKGKVKIGQEIPELVARLFLPLLRNKGHKKAAFLFSHVESKKRRFCVVFSF